MEMSSDDVKNIAEGATKGLLDWTKEQILEFVNKINNKDLIFIQDNETIDLVKEQLKTGEWDVYNKYVKDTKLRILIQTGLTLRRLEQNKEKLQNLRNKLISK